MKMHSSFSRVIVFLMVLMVLFSPQVQLAAWYAPSKPQLKDESPLIEYLDEFSRFRQKCPKIFQDYSIDQMLDLIDCLEKDDNSCIAYFEEINQLSKFIQYLAEVGGQAFEGLEYINLEKDLKHLPGQILSQIEEAHQNENCYDRSDLPLQIEKESSVQYTLEAQSWKKYWPNPQYYGIGTKWIALKGVPHHPAFLANQKLFELCQSNWSDCKRFVKKHKTEVIIGAVIVVAIIVVSVIAINYSAVAAAGGIAGGAVVPLEKKEPKQIGTSQEGSPLISVSQATEILREELENIESSNQTDKNQVQVTAKEYISNFAHKIVDEIHDEIEPLKSLTESVQEFLGLGEEHKALGQLVFGISKEQLEDLKDNSHEAIDNLFGTDLSSIYNQEKLWASHSIQERQEAEELLKQIAPDIVELWLPPPGFGKKPIDQLPGKIPITSPSATRGWKAGQPINNLTSNGNVPSWSTVRARYWKNRHYLYQKYGDPIERPFEYSKENLKRMVKGRAPKAVDPETKELVSMELHHKPPQRDGGLFDFEEIPPWEHAEKDSSRYYKRK